MRASSLVETGFNPEEETYENACKVLHYISARTLRASDYNGMLVICKDRLGLTSSFVAIVRRSGPGWSFTESIPYLLSLLGYTLDDLDRLSPIQITATKGKQDHRKCLHRLILWRL